MNEHNTHLALSTDRNIVVAALAANVIASAGGTYRRDVDDAIWAASPVLAALGAQEAAAVKYSVDFVNCQTDAAAALNELVRGSLSTELAPTSTSTDEAAYARRKARLKRLARKHGFRFYKSNWRRDTIDNRGGYRLIDIGSNLCVGGVSFDMDLDDIENDLMKVEG